MASSSSSISSPCGSFPIAESSTSQRGSSASCTYSYPTSFPEHELPAEIWLEIIRYAVSPQEEDADLTIRAICSLRTSGQFFSTLIDDNADYILATFWKALAMKPCPSFQRFLAEAEKNAMDALQPGEEVPSNLSRFSQLTESFKKRGIPLQKDDTILFHPSQYDVAMQVFDGNLERVWPRLAYDADLINTREIVVNTQRTIRADGLPIDQRRIRGIPLLNAQEIRHELYKPENQERIRHVYRLYLNACDLTALPLEIGLFTGLIELTLSDNFLRVLPPEIGQLTQLEALDVNANQLTTLPSEIGRLSQLRNLGVCGNMQFVSQTRSFSGDVGFKTFPPEIIQLTQLEWIDFRKTPLGRGHSIGSGNLSPEILKFLAGVRRVEFESRKR